MLHFFKRQAARSMVAAGFCLATAAPFWLGSLSGSSLDWAGNSVGLWFRRHGPVAAISAAGSLLFTGLALMAIGLYLGSQRQAGKPPD